MIPLLVMLMKKGLELPSKLNSLVDISMNEEEIFTGGQSFRITIEFDSGITLRLAEALFTVIRGRNVKVSGEDSIDFEVMYAGELANVLIALDESFDDNYCMTFRWTEGRTGVYIMVMAI